MLLLAVDTGLLIGIGFGVVGISFWIIGLLAFKWAFDRSEAAEGPVEEH